MTNLYGSGSSMMLTIEANKENIPPGFALHSKEQIVLPEPRPMRPLDDNGDSTSPIPRPSPSMSQVSDASFVSCQDSSIINTSADEADDDMETTSRKEKSLGLLCQRFLIAMNEETRNSATKEVHLETVARKMNVEKRRIYDIVNVMEALDAMQKTNKSYYQWQGLEELPKLMFDLQVEAIEEGLPERVLRVEQAMCSFTELSSPSGKKANSKEVVGSFVASSSDPSTSKCDSVTTAPSDIRRSRVDNRDRQGRNSLAQLCRRFLMVLLSNPKNVRKVSLDVASTVLIKDPETEGFEPPSRSRCRRLYDIANVLVALGLIKKVHYLFGTKKIPLFVYCGPEPDTNGHFDVYASVERLLSSQQNTPTTPTIRATTDKIVQQLAGFGKRAHSDPNFELTLNGTTSKLAKLRSQQMPPPPSPKSANPLMMFAEIAANERMRLDALARFTSMPNALLPSTSTPILPSRMGDTMSNIQYPNGVPISPLADTNIERKPFGSPFTYVDTAFMPFSMPNTRPNCTSQSFSRRSPTKEVKPPMKHSMSNILGVSNKSNISAFDHTNTSPFQIVKKGESRQKKIFGEIQNLQ